MKKLLLILFILFTSIVYSQEYDDVYYTVYDVDSDTLIEDSDTYVTNNYYMDYASRINRFHRRPYYASYWSYYNPYWYSYYYPFYTNFYWWWYSPYWNYYGWYSHDNYSHWYSNYQTYYSHHHRHYDKPKHYAHHNRSSNNVNKKIVVHKPIKVNENRQHYSTYQKPKDVKYIHIRPNVNIKNVTSSSSNNSTYTKPRNIQRNVKINKPPGRIQRTPPINNRTIKKPARQHGKNN